MIRLGASSYSRVRRSFLQSRSHSTKQFLPSKAYQELVSSGKLTEDGCQFRIIRKYLDKLHHRLMGYALPTMETPEDTKEDTEGKEEESKEPPQVLVPRGLYLHGSVGTGKSMLMDLFFRHAPVESKRRVHFNSFMLEVHSRLQQEKKRQLEVYGRKRHIDLDTDLDPIRIVANEIARESHLLCFDEFQVTDIADALIMKQLFGQFFANGVVMVATSNLPPSELYKDGINREYFLPFLDQLSKHTRVVDIQSETDYRMISQLTADKSYLSPLSPNVAKQIDDIYHELRGECQDQTLDIPVMMGRRLVLQGASNGICRSTFNYLCNTEKAAADYKALAEHFHTVIVENIPSLDLGQHDQMRRFIILLDELYEHRVRLICSADTSIHHLFYFEELLDDAESSVQVLPDNEEDKAKKKREMEALGIPVSSSWDAPVGAHTLSSNSSKKHQDLPNVAALHDLKIAFRRAVSRLREMQSQSYLDDNILIRDDRQRNLRRALLKE